MRKTIIYLFITAALTGCTTGNNTPGAEEPQSTEIAATAAVDKKNEGMEVTKPPEVTATNNTNEADRQNPPRYLDESDYEGDELGIVKTLNLYMKAFYERDHDAFYKLLAKDNNWKIDDFKKYFVSIDKLDFSIVPDPALLIPKDVKSVVIEYKVKYDDREDIRKEPGQMFSFRFEDGAWKLTAIADWGWR